MAGKPFVPVEHRLALTVPEAAALCGIPEKVVRAAVVHGDLRHFEKGSTTARIRRSESGGLGGLAVSPTRIGTLRHTCRV